MKNNLDKIVVVGQGAMGLLWYHHLSSINNKINENININKLNDTSDCSVTLLSSDIAAVRMKKTPEASYQFTAFTPSDIKQSSDSCSFHYPLSYASLKDIESADVILLCLKSYAINEALEQIASNVAKHCVIVLAHNGMGTLTKAKELLPNGQTIVAMLTTHGCLRDAPLSIRHTGLGTTDIGLLSGKLSTPTQQKLVNRLNLALPTVRYHKNIEEKQWLKLAVNCVINPLTAINDVENGAINTAEFNGQVKAILSEIVAISHAEEIHLDKDELIALVANVATATTKNSSSMRCDVNAGRKTEIDYINGYVHRLGMKHHIATPENTRLWQQVSKLKIS